MKTNYEVRYASNPIEAKTYDTTRLRKDFLIENVFVKNEVNLVYSMYDRMIVGGAMPVGETLLLEAIDPLKAPFFLTRREMGIFNVGGKGRVLAGDKVYELDFDENLIVNLKKRGVNLVRLGLTWDGVEPEAGKYDEDYLDRVQRMYYRDRSHVRVTMWSLGNESGGYKCQDVCYKWL